MIASVAGVNTPLNMNEVDVLTVNDIKLFENGTPTVTETELFTLAGGQTNNKGTFEFTGEATPTNASEESNPSFKLVLSFAPDVEED